MSTTRLPSAHAQNPDSRPSDRYIPWIFVAFFAVVFAVNGAMVAIALDTFTGLATFHPYEKGIAWNRSLAEAAAEAKLGWVMKADATALKRGGGRILVTLNGADGAALTGAKVEARFIRPTNIGSDTETRLAETAAGVYEGEPALPLAGQWELVVIADHDGAHYQTVHRILVPE